MYDISDKELQRLAMMSVYENELHDAGYTVIAGMDEVGCGPLAGPVVACCLILPAGVLIEGVNDSKKLSPTKRKLICTEILSSALDVSIGVVDEDIIDEINILQATRLAMRKAIENLTIKPDAVIVDGRPVPGLPSDIFQKYVIKGDNYSITVAAASIVAKVERDKMMEKFHEYYPEYNFIKNKGYGTAEHIEAIKKHGLSPIHRISFTRRFS